MLVGDFPEALLSTSAARLGKEIVAGDSSTVIADSHNCPACERSEIVLTDLDGKWENVYSQNKIPFTYTVYHQLTPKIINGADLKQNDAFSIASVTYETLSDGSGEL